MPYVRRYGQSIRSYRKLVEILASQIIKGISTSFHCRADGFMQGISSIEFINCNL